MRPGQMVTVADIHSIGADTVTYWIFYFVSIRQKVRAWCDNLQTCRRDVGERRPHGHPDDGPPSQGDPGGQYNSIKKLLGLLQLSFAHVFISGLLLLCKAYTVVNFGPIAVQHKCYCIASQGFFNRPIDNLQAYPFMVRYIQESVRE